MVGLDWHRHAVGRQRLPCRLCGQGAFLRDEHGRPCHKVCAEAAIDAAPRVVDPNGPRDGLADLLPLAPVIDLATRRRVA